MWGQRSLLPQVRRLGTLLRVDDWQRPVSTCVLTGEVDPMVNVDDMRLLYRQLETPKRLIVLARAGHLHWADGAEAAHERYRQGYLSGSFPDPEIDAIALGIAMRPFSELCPEADAAETMRALCVAHMDAHLKDNAGATCFLDSDLQARFHARGIDLREATGERGGDGPRAESKADWRGELRSPNLAER
jgi:hypothetical protein